MSEIKKSKFRLYMEAKLQKRLDTDPDFKARWEAKQVHIQEMKNNRILKNSKK